ncbi:MAG: hypothetical protein Q7V57_13785 [Actinomycetota bacterium]|nr:hypothetical protein [Actinomycetota bacterium]
MALRRQRHQDTAAQQADVTGSNPLLLEFRARLEPTHADVEALTARYAFAIPTDRALAAIQRYSASGVVEIGAGTGYWASLVRALGVPIDAYDPAPPMSADNKWFHSSAAWFEVQPADETVVAQHGDRTLLLVWPTRDQTWPADALEQFLAAGGRTVIHVGEGPGGRTGDARYHALLGGYVHCVACTYGAHDLACVCGTQARWQQVDRVSLPHWPGHHDDLFVYSRRDVPGEPLGPRGR